MGRTFEVCDDLDEALTNADAVYLQRLQDEYGGGDAQKHEQELESLRLTPSAHGPASTACCGAAPAPPSTRNRPRHRP